MRAVRRRSGRVPGRHLVTLFGAAWLAVLLDAGRFRLLHARGLGAATPLPATLDHLSVAPRFSAA